VEDFQRLAYSVAMPGKKKRPQTTAKKIKVRGGKGKKALVTGGRGFIGSHLVDYLLTQGYQVTIIDNGLSGDCVHEHAPCFEEDIRNLEAIEPYFTGVDTVFHFAAIARTPWCVEDPSLAYSTNVLGSVNVLEAARKAGVGKVILSSSNIVYAGETPYKYSKLAMEDIASVYRGLYRLPTVCLRYSNVYGPRQREDGVAPNVFASFRKSFRERGFIEITGDGEQSRDFTHVRDIARANVLAATTPFMGVLDICTGRNVSMNYVAKELFNAPVRYVGERVGDIKHIIQKPEVALKEIGWKYQIELEDGIKDVL
jgi:UDP-glucose 4-epimerase